jgi:CheY-like chemotaxis protein
MKILLVEDDADILEFEEFFFRKHFSNADVFVAGNGLEAFNLCTQHCFDFIVTDINMPIMDGFKFIEKISKECPNAFSKIYILSGCLANESNLPKDIKIAKFFSKPMSYESLTKDIELDLKL